ncbi:unnamed protein product [Zymoseptoria tritici ST99CH_1A5]|uniref:Uncharacterized protein n=1 Tax=Zymoseptoria tritici ST99CH_1A5 TaxID=1276529 RepID=A0A1Y6LW51_ZYMTR|nr:unnamed protein product [Zymoseptoria tritici ST99CH_1A5]
MSGYYPYSDYPSDPSYFYQSRPSLPSSATSARYQPSSTAAASLSYSEMYAPSTPSSCSQNPYARSSASHHNPYSSSTRDNPYLPSIDLYGSSSSRDPMRLAESMHPPRAASLSRYRDSGPRPSTASDRAAYADPYYLGPGYGPSPPPRQPSMYSRAPSPSARDAYLPNRRPSYFDATEPSRDLYGSRSGTYGSDSSYQAGYTATRPSPMMYGSRPSTSSGGSLRRPSGYDGYEGYGGSSSRYPDLPSGYEGGGSRRRNAYY